MRAIPLKNQYLLQLKFTCLVSLALIFYLIYFVFFKESFYRFAGFYFDSQFNEFKVWFPRFYIPAFIFIQFLNVVWIIVILAVSTKLFILINNYFEIKLVGNLIPLKQIIVSNLLIFACYLIFTLTVYYNLNAISDSSKYNFIFNQAIARFFVLNFVFQLIVILYTNKKEVIERVKDFFLMPTLPYNISILRIIFFSYLILVYLSKFLSRLPTVDLKNKVSLPFIGWLIEFLPVNSAIYSILVFVGIISCLFIIVGYKTRIFLIINGITIFYIMATPNFFGKLWHEQIVIWISWFFVFSRCYDIFSIDSKLNNTAIVKSPDYTFPVRFVWISFGVIYFWAGFYKLWDGGFDWALSDSMINQIQLEWAQHYDKIPAIRIDKSPNLLNVLGMVVIFFEMTFIILLFNKKWKWVAVIGGLLMHNILGYFIYISFFFLLQVFYVFFFDFSFLVKKQKEIVRESVSYSKKAFNFGIIIIGFNFIFGMFNINSYPFSSYPSYSAIIKKDLKILEFRCDNRQTNLIIGKQNNFRWEDYGWLEYNLIRDYEAGKNVKNDILNYWEIWKSKNPQLCDCDTVKVNLLIRPLKPEKRNLIKKIKTIDTLIININ